MNRNELMIELLGDELHEALTTGSVVDPISTRFPNLDIEDGYAISKQLLSNRIIAGSRLVGKKIGLTNRKAQSYFGLDEPGFGYLMDTMAHPPGKSLCLDNLLIQPKIEVEIAFVLGEGLHGENCNAADVLDATEYLMCCFEIADCRIRDWRIGAVDFAADNGCGGLFVLGDTHFEPGSIDVQKCKMTLRENGEIVSEGVGTDVFGSPANSVAWLARKLGKLEAGEIILSGSLGPVVSANSGSLFELDIASMEALSIQIG